MRTANLVEAHPTYFNLNGKPLVGRIAIFERDTQQFSEVWLNPEGTTRASNPMKTNGAGKTEQQVFVEMPDSGQKAYTIYVQEFLGDDASSMDEYWTDDSMWKTLYDYLLVVDAGSGVKSVTVDSVSEIAGADSSNGIVVAKGFYFAGDCPARTFVYTSRKVFPEDGCTSIKSKDGGYWTWFPDPVIDSGCFGIIQSASKENIASSLLSLQTHLASSKVIKKVCFRGGTYFVSTSASLDCELEFKPNATLTPLADSSISCRRISASSGFVKRFLSSSTWKLSLSVSEGDYVLSWYGDGFDSIEEFGTPERIVVDRSMTTTVPNFRNVEFVPSIHGTTLKLSAGTSSLYNCTFGNSPCLDLSSSEPTFSYCGKTRTSSVCDGFKASFIANSTNTPFVVDSEISMDSDLSQENISFTTEDGAFFNGMADSGLLTISEASVRNKSIACDCAITGTKKIRLDWFHEWTGRSTCCINAMIGSGIYSVDLCGDSISFSATNYDFTIENGSASGGPFQKKTVFNNVSANISASGAELYSYDSALSFTTCILSKLVASGSTLVGQSLALTGTLNLSSSKLQFASNEINGDTILNDSSILDSGTLKATNFTAYDSVVNLDVESELSGVYGSTVKSLTTASKQIFSSSCGSLETVHDNGTESFDRKTVTFSDGFMGKTAEESYRLYDVIAQMRMNAGIYCAASQGRSGYDIFSMIPSMPIFITQDKYVSLVDAKGSSRSFETQETSHSVPVYSGTAYGIIGDSRPKPGQVLVIVPSDSETCGCIIARAIRSNSFAGTTDIENRYGGLMDTSLQFFSGDRVDLQLVVNEGPIVLVCLGPGYNGSNSYPIFWNVNGTKYAI